MFRKVIAIALGLGLIVPGLQATRIADALMAGTIKVKEGLLDLRKKNYDNEDFADLWKDVVDSKYAKIPAKLSKVTVIDIRNNKFNSDSAIKISMFPYLRKVYYGGNEDLEKSIIGGGFIIHRFEFHPSNLDIEFWVGPNQESIQKDAIQRGTFPAGTVLKVAGVALFAHWLSRKFNIFDRFNYGWLGLTLPHARRQEIADKYHAADKDDRPAIERKIRSVFSTANADAIMDTPPSEK